jgi:vesicle coat complex subunit
MPSKVVQTNVKSLRSMRSGASEKVRDIIDEVIDLYNAVSYTQIPVPEKKIC